jgi:phage-related holin
MVLFILGYVTYFGWIGHNLFKGDLEGSNNFASFGDSIWSMWILITTANFPDVMLHAYSETSTSFIFFYVFLNLGLFLFINLLVAIFYSAYQDNIDLEIDDKTE